MIASVRGRVLALTGQAAIVEVGGVGMLVQCSPATLVGLRSGEEALLHTSLVVREDSLTLFGFPEADERGVFEVLQTASGVGPRLAQAMLAVHPPDALRRAVASEDLAALVQVPGIGRKGAQRIVLELRDKLGPPLGGAAPGSPGAPAPALLDEPWRTQLHAALLGLGWSGREADEAVEAVAPQAVEQVDAGRAGGTPDVAALLRQALRSLSRA